MQLNYKYLLTRGILLVVCCSIYAIGVFEHVDEQPHVCHMRTHSNNQPLSPV